MARSTQGRTQNARPGRQPGGENPAIADGCVIGEYVVQRPLGGGGYGDVYLAEHSVIGRRVALKILHPQLKHSREVLERFEREARAANLIRHPNIVDVIGFGETTDGRPYFVMELLDGESLDVVLDRGGRFTVEDALAIFDPVASALEAAHAIGIVHRDVKASNVMLIGGADRRLQIKLLDFGIAKFPQPRVSGATATGQRLGTPISMAPEQIRGQAVDHRADVYALGVLLYHLLVGRPPFDAPDDVEIERMHLESPVPRMASEAAAARSLDEVVQKCMAKSAEDRYQTVAELRAAVKAAAAGAPAGASAPQPRLAVGILVAVTSLDGAPLDEATLERCDEVLAAAERSLRARSFQVLVGDATTLFAARPVGSADETTQKLDALDAARQLDAAVRRKLQPGLAVATAVHVAAVDTDDHGAITGGALLDTPAWAGSRSDGLVATDALLDGLPAT